MLFSSTLPFSEMKSPGLIGSPLALMAAPMFFAPRSSYCVPFTVTLIGVIAEHSFTPSTTAKSSTIATPILKTGIRRAVVSPP